MSEKNRDFAQVRVGTVVGFDRSEIGHVKSDKPYELFAKGEGSRGHWFMFDGETEFASDSVDETTWRVNGGYIISQPEDAQEEARENQKAAIERGVDAMIDAEKWRSKLWHDSAIGSFQYERNGKPWYLIRDHEQEEQQQDTVILFGTHDREECDKEFHRAVLRRYLTKALAAMDQEAGR